jgi:hypothetical protein
MVMRLEAIEDFEGEGIDLAMNAQRRSTKLSKD